MDILTNDEKELLRDALKEYETELSDDEIEYLINLIEADLEAS